jgi:hypothetical protein
MEVKKMKVITGAKICLAFASGWTGTRQVRVVIEYTK